MMIRSALLAVGLWAGCGDLFKQPNFDRCIEGCDEADMSRPKERRFVSFKRSVTPPSPLWIGATKVSGEPRLLLWDPSDDRLKSFKKDASPGLSYKLTDMTFTEGYKAPNALAVPFAEASLFCAISQGGVYRCPLGVAETVECTFVFAGATSLIAVGASSTTPAAVRNPKSQVFEGPKLVTEAFAMADVPFTTVQIEDVSGDSKPDVIGLTSDSLQVYLDGAPSARFATNSCATCAEPSPGPWLSIADLGGQPGPDVLLAGPGQIKLYLNDGAGQFSKQTAKTQTIPSLVAAIALKRNAGLTEVVAFTTDEVAVYRPQAGQADPLERVGVAVDKEGQPLKVGTPAFLLARDLDDDGHEDLVVYDAAAGELRVFMSTAP